MGQTLTHGIYLPDEGERNCYSGLAANWQILDGSVGTIAAHTAALSGKAPLVHTHTKSDITDFPAYGNTAGTICEGNDSRLSDARTPVAHTHTKADVTNLFNSANEWTANNYFPLTGFYLRGFSVRASVPASNEFSQCAFADTNNSPLMSINSANRTTGVRDITLRVYTSAGNANGAGIFKDASDNYSFCSLDPNNTINLGTSINKWKSFNGTNPGALSLPTSSYVEIDTTNWDLTGATSQSYTPAVHGWLYIAIQNIAGNYLSMAYRRGAVSIDGTGVQSGLKAMLPVVANESVSITVKTGSIFAARFYPCLGNV